MESLLHYLTGYKGMINVFFRENRLEPITHASGGPWRRHRGTVGWNIELCMRENVCFPRGLHFGHFLLETPRQILLVSFL